MERKSGGKDPIKDFISALEPAEPDSCIIATSLLIDKADKLDKDDVDRLIDIITTAEDAPWRSLILIHMAADAGVLGKLNGSQFKRLADAAELATERNKPKWLKAIEAIIAFNAAKQK